MGHKCDYYAEVKANKKSVYMIITAKWKNRKETVYYENTLGKIKSRYLYFNTICGYVVTFPNEILNYYYGYQTQEKEKMYEIERRCNLYVTWKSKEKDIERLIEKKPELKYLLRKFTSDNPYTLIDTIKSYEKDHSVEFLIGNGLFTIANDKRLPTLKKTTKNKVIQKINSELDYCKQVDISLTRVLSAIKNKCSIREVKCKKPSLDEKLSDYNNNYKVVNKYQIFIPNKERDIKEQAEKLHQCLITCDYDKKMANKKTILIFIRKDNIPVATCEIDTNKKILQFYIDELDRQNCKPDKYLKETMNEYLQQLDMNNLYKGAINV